MNVLSLFDGKSGAMAALFKTYFGGNKMNCKNCKWLCDPEMSSVCWNDKSPHCADFVLPNDVCEHWQNHDNEILGDSK
jgi:hypothetical protein